MFNVWTHKPRWWWKILPPNMTKEEAEREIQNMYLEYCKWNHGFYGFFVGSSLCGNKNGDEARYCHLKRIINYWHTN